jgi:hypothetical protein
MAPAKTGLLHHDLTGSSKAISRMLSISSYHRYSLRASEKAIRRHDPQRTAHPRAYSTSISVSTRPTLPLGVSISSIVARVGAMSLTAIDW